MNTMPSSNRYDRTLVLQIGLLTSLSLVLLAFRWQSPLSNAPEFEQVDETMQLVDFDQAVQTRVLPSPAATNPRLSSAQSDFSSNNFQAADWPVDKGSMGKLPDLPDEFLDTSDVFMAGAEVFPEFPGGTQALMTYLAKNIRYNPQAIEFRITGKVYISFVVLPNGAIDDVRVLKGLGFGLDDEAIRVVKAMPRWQPGTQNGQPVAVVYNLPIQFSLR